MTCSGCGGSKYPKVNVTAAIADHLQTQPDQPFDLGTLGSDEWQKICVLDPYTANTEGAKILGFNWDFESQSSIKENDGINLLVFVKDQSVVAFAEHLRHKGDFTSLEPSCLDREDAVVKPRKGTKDWISFVKDE
ncbi:hypothetical protein ACSYAD_15805 [Acaryochloris marina NIES-2412]|uniref:hypothetical protein n=1 Tax=Acaryochloris marina TaxID=155978 RepID=UPI004059655C